jgi:hypothetical protein
VVPEANKELIETNRSFATNTNTVTTHLTNAVGPQTVHDRSKQTVGTDINLFSQKRTSTHCQGGDVSSTVSANDKSLGTAINMTSCVTSTRYQENNEKIDDVTNPSRQNGKD